ncbi:MAG: pyrimidine dimer DNA glycosylase/endonuclease V [Candidatus Woesearchaeota archaeon]|jgi:hypothetical protein
MRLWSIHPKYLDRQGLLAVWREGLLAKKVLEGKTKGYTKHPQALRFKHTKDPLKAINQYLKYIEKEAKKREYTFDKTKITRTTIKSRIPVSKEQLLFELQHLKNKLKKRSPQKYEEIKKIKTPETHPSFKIKKTQELLR